MSDVMKNDSLAKSQILRSIIDLNKSDLEGVNVWLTSQQYRNDLDNLRELRKAQGKLDAIRKTIKRITTLRAEFATENINFPQVGDHADCTEESTCHVDEFLYSEEDIEIMVHKGEIKRRYCADCNSRNIKDLTFISHSMSKEAIQYVFKVLLPANMSNMVVIDVGSRMGAVLFGAYFFSNASKIIGIEINKEWCDVAEHVIQKFELDANRIKAIRGDVMDRSDLIVTANVFIVNVLDFFVDVTTHREMWRFFKSTFPQGSYVVTNRSMMETWGDLEISHEFHDWLKIVHPCQPENEAMSDFDDFNYGDLYLYMVK